MVITLHLPDLTQWVTLLSVIAGIVGLIDGIARIRGSKILGIIEIVVSALILAAIFFDFHISVPVTTLAIILEIVLIVGLFLRGGLRRGGIALTIVALVATSLLLLEAFGWLHLPALKG